MADTFGHFSAMITNTSDQLEYLQVIDIYYIYFKFVLYRVLYLFYISLLLIQYNIIRYNTLCTIYNTVMSITRKSVHCDTILVCNYIKRMQDISLQLFEGIYIMN